MKMLRRFICLVLVFSLCLSLALPSRAVAVLDDILVAVVLAFLAGAGIALTLPTTTEKSTVTDTVMGMLRDYASDVGSTLDNLFPAAGLWLSAKAYRVSPSFGNALAGFVRWLQGADGYELQDNSTVPVVQGGASFYGIPCFPVVVGQEYSSSGSYATKWRVDSVDCPLYASFMYRSSGGFCLCLLIDGDLTSFYSVTYSYFVPSSATWRSLTLNSFQGNCWKFSSSADPQVTLFRGFQIGDIQSETYDFSWTHGSGSPGYNYVIPAEQLSGVGVSSSGGIDLVAGTVTNIPEVATDSQVVISSPAIPVGASDLTIASDAVIEAVLEGAGAIEAVNDIVLAQEGTLDPPVPPVVDDTYPIVGLDEIFPFCIPFDLYEFVNILSAEPVAPSFTWAAAFPDSIGGTQTVELDFDTPTWNTLAQILRTMELLLFIVGLAFVTRQLLRG